MGKTREEIADTGDKVADVGGGDDDRSARFQDTVGLFEQVVGALGMFHYLDGIDNVEVVVWEWNDRVGFYFRASNIGILKLFRYNFTGKDDLCRIKFEFPGVGADPLRHVSKASTEVEKPGPFLYMGLEMLKDGVVGGAMGGGSNLH